MFIGVLIFEWELFALLERQMKWNVRDQKETIGREQTWMRFAPSKSCSQGPALTNFGPD